MRFETLAVHAGAERDATGAIAPPIHLSTTFEHGPDGARGAHGYLYVRYDNPTQRRLEEALAAIEGGDTALAFASGVAAGAAYLQSLPAGSHVLLPTDYFYGFRGLVPTFLPRWGITWSEVDMTDPDAVRAAVRPATRLLWAETVSNPLMGVTDVAAVAEVAHAAGARLLVDATFSTPALVRPLELGADVVLHSTTKYLGGHSDVMGGALVFARADETSAAIVDLRTLLGAVASPFAAWLVLRGLRTLGARMRIHSANARTIAVALAAHAAVTEVRYPGHGGMLSFQVTGGRTRAIAVASRVRLFTNAGSLGGPESLLQHAVSIMHPADGIPDDLLRVSVGLEHPDDLIADLDHALGTGRR
jgi:cystathionine gamma-synthase